MEALSILTMLVLLLIVLVIISMFRKPPAISGMENIGDGVTNLRLEVKGLFERIQNVEQNQASSSTTISAFLSDAKSDLNSLQTLMKSRQGIERQTNESIRRLEAIIAGTHSKGMAGENILDYVFSKLPPEWQVRDLRVGDKHVEFGLRLPSNLVLPIDSKWTATNLVEEFVNCDDVDQQQKLKTEINRTVLNKAKEVRKYVDPNLTMTFGVAAVPDAVYDICAECCVEALKMNVVIISYSMFLPYLLPVFQTVSKMSSSIDLQRLQGYLNSVEESVKVVQDELEGRFTRAMTMLSNSRDDMRSQLAKANTGLTSLQMNTGELDQ